ncbi:MAG: LysE family translocator [Pseudomonadota bacterium]
MVLETYLVYLAAVAVFFATPPGTSQLLMISNSIRYGVRRSIFTMAGDLTANALQMTAAAFGLAVVISASASAFVWIKWLGVAYLAWIGLRLFFSKGSGPGSAASRYGTPIRLFRQGFITSMANPFAVVFFGALFPQFIDPALSIWTQLLVLGGTYLLIDAVILLFWGWLAASTASALFRRSSIWVNRICGSLMLAAAAFLASRDLQPRR